jgi:hypothetical protein
MIRSPPPAPSASALCGHVPTYDDPQQVTQVLLEGSS